MLHRYALFLSSTPPILPLQRGGTHSAYSHYPPSPYPLPISRLMRKIGEGKNKRQRHWIPDQSLSLTFVIEDRG